MIVNPDHHGETHEEVHHDGYHESVPIWQDTATWVLIPFTIVVVIFIWKKVPTMLNQSLDARGKAIADELEAARSLREEAQELLASYQRKQKEAEDEAQSIIDQAKADATLMAEESRTKLDDQMARRLQAAEDKIQRAEQQAINDIRKKTTLLSVAATEQIIKNMDDSSKTAILDKSIAEVTGKLH